MSATKATLTEGATTIEPRERGLLVTEVGEFTTSMYFIPRCKSMSITAMGGNVHVWFGRTLHLTMPDSMWATHETVLIAAALGEDVTP